MKLVANKVGSSTGDMRKALHACKSALDQMEKQERVVLKETADDGKFLAFKGIVVYRRFSNCRRSLTMAGSLINAGGIAIAKCTFPASRTINIFKIPSIWLNGIVFY